MNLPFVQTNVFVDLRYPFSGNQLATFVDKEVNKRLTKEEMQGIAGEMNFSETTFCLSSSIPEVEAKVRIFTPGKEVPFAGHPTLGTAYVLAEPSKSGEEKTLTLELGVGPIQTNIKADGFVTMKQPPAAFLDVIDDITPLANALGLVAEDLHEHAPPQFVTTGFPFLIVPLKSLEIVRAVSPDIRELGQLLEGSPSKEVLVFSSETVNSDGSFHARMFAPFAGVLEDPATGSAAGPLGAYVEEYELTKSQRGQPIIIEQGYEIRRPSQLFVEVGGDAVVVGGRVKRSAEGTYFLEK